MLEISFQIAMGLAAYYALGLIWIIACRLAGSMVLNPIDGVPQARCEMIMALLWPYLIYLLVLVAMRTPKRR